MGTCWGRIAHLKLPIPRKTKRFLQSCLAGHRPEPYTDMAYHAGQLAAALHPWRFLETQLESLGVEVPEGVLDPTDDRFGSGVWVCQADGKGSGWRLSPWPKKTLRKKRSRAAQESKTEVIRE